MPPEVVVRPYRAGDRSAVRQICCDTADLGLPVERVFHDRDVAADFLTRYYTDDEPQASWVAECGGRVIGYLTGCLDVRRYRRRMAMRIAPASVARAVLRGALWRRQTWRLLSAWLATWRRGGFERRVPLAQYPTHLHLNILEGFRGQGVARALLERFTVQVRAEGLQGIHASVREDNVPACRFFERMGFVVVQRWPVVLPEAATFPLHFIVLYAKSLAR